MTPRAARRSTLKHRARLCVTALVTLLASAGCGSACTSGDKATAEPSAGPGQTSWHRAAGLRVLEVELGPHDAALPMVFFVHGRGDHANAGWVEHFDEPARYMFPEAPTPWGDGFSWFAFRANGNPELLARDIARAEGQLSSAITELTKSRPTVGKPIVAGFSQGAMLAYALALTHPSQLAFALPVSGMLPVPFYRDLPRAGARYPPIHALHGSDDEVVPTAGTIQMVNALHARGLDISLATFDGAEHEINRPMRAKMLGDLREAISSERAAEPRPARP